MKYGRGATWAGGAAAVATLAALLLWRGAAVDGGGGAEKATEAADPTTRRAESLPAVVVVNDVDEADEQESSPRPEAVAFFNELRERLPRFRGRVVDSRGAEVAGYPVFAQYRSTSESLALEVRTRLDGTFVFPGESAEEDAERVRIFMSIEDIRAPARGGDDRILAALDKHAPQYLELRVQDRQDRRLEWALDEHFRRALTASSAFELKFLASADRSIDGAAEIDVGDMVAEKRVRRRFDVAGTDGVRPRLVRVMTDKERVDYSPSHFEVEAEGGAIDLLCDDSFRRAAFGAEGYSPSTVDISIAELDPRPTVVRLLPRGEVLVALPPSSERVHGFILRAIAKVAAPRWIVRPAFDDPRHFGVPWDYAWDLGAPFENVRSTSRRAVAFRDIPHGLDLAVDLSVALFDGDSSMTYARLPVGTLAPGERRLVEAPPPPPLATIDLTATSESGTKLVGAKTTFRTGLCGLRGTATTDRKGRVRMEDVPREGVVVEVETGDRTRVEARFDLSSANAELRLVEPKTRRVAVKVLAADRTPVGDTFLTEARSAASGRLSDGGAEREIVARHVSRADYGDDDRLWASVAEGLPGELVVAYAGRRLRYPIAADAVEVATTLPRTGVAVLKWKRPFVAANSEDEPPPVHVLDLDDPEAEPWLYGGRPVEGSELEIELAPGRYAIFVEPIRADSLSRAVAPAAEVEIRPGVRAIAPVER
jgi:hypothetical protein